MCCLHDHHPITQVLDLSGNSISSLEGLEGLPCLYDINVEENEVLYNYYYIHVHVECMLPYLESTSTYMCICMCTHTSTFSKFFLFQVVDIREVEHLKGLKLLRALNLSNNPIQVSMLSSIRMVQLPCMKIASIAHHHETIQS